MKVGVLAYRFEYYTYTRTLVGIVPDVEYIKVRDLYTFLTLAARRINSAARRQLINHFDLNNQFNDFDLNKIDLLHLFNGISYGKTPWVGGFETILPRLRSILPAQHGRYPGFKDVPNRLVVKRAFSALAGESCKFIHAISNCSAAMQLDLLNAFAEYGDAISKKMVVKHPPQTRLMETYQKPELPDGGLNFILVGASFFRKGGMEIVETFRDLREKYGYPIELTLVTSLRVDPYATAETEEDVTIASRFIRENQGWIHHYDSLPNPEALEKMKGAHVGLLPTYADSYGFSLLEMQAAGCPVISTNVRALPEINNEDVGWLIEVPKNRLGEAIYTTASDRQTISTAIRQGLERAVHEIFTNPSLVAVKGQNALERISREHDPDQYAAWMAEIYRAAIHQQTVRR